MITPRHSYSDSDRETATNDAWPSHPAPPVPAPAGDTTAVRERRRLTLMWATVLLLGTAGMAAAYLRHAHAAWGWGAPLGALGVGMLQFVFGMAWYQARDLYPVVAPLEVVAAAPAEGAARRPSPHPQ